MKFYINALFIKYHYNTKIKIKILIFKIILN